MKHLKPPNLKISMKKKSEIDILNGRYYVRQMIFPKIYLPYIKLSIIHNIGCVT